MLKLNSQHKTAIARHGEQDYPHECCGLLIGRFDPDEAKVVLETYPISNAREETAKRNRFLIRPEELMRGERYARERKLDVVGVYHSHPDHPAQPSQFDLEHALPVWSYIIVAVAGGSAGEMNSFELAADRSSFLAEQTVEIKV